MATTAVDPGFVDTNILIYARVAVSPFHAAAVTRLDDLQTAGHPLWTSRQILREYLAALTRPGTVTVPLPVTALVADVQSFEKRFFIAEAGAAVTAQLLSLLAAISC